MKFGSIVAKLVYFLKLTNALILFDNDFLCFYIFSVD